MQRIATMTGAKTTAPGVSLADYADPATRAQDLLDTISIIRVASRALEDIAVGYGDKLPKQCMIDMQLVIAGLKCAHQRGRIQTTKVSPVPSLLAAYDMRTAADRNEKGCEAPPRRFKGSTALWEVKQFVGSCKEPRTVAPKRPAQEEVSEESPPKKQRRSERTVTPEKSLLDPPNGAEKWNQRALFSAMTDLIGTGEVESFVKGVLERGPLMLGGTEYNTSHSIYKLFNAKGFTGKPPNGKMKWEKEALAVYMSRLESETGLSVKAFLRKVLEVGKTDYRGTSGVYKMYTSWKANGRAGLRSGGRPPIAPLTKIDKAVQEKFDKREDDSSAFKLKHMKEFLAKCKREKAEADGLDPETIDDSVSDPTAKKAQIAAAMRKHGSQKTSSLTNKNLMTKTEPRWRAEHSVQGGYAYALTVLSTHFCEGPCPPHLAKQFKYDELSPDVKETYEMVKESLDAEEIHPVDPNLVTSTDDTTLFVFEGCPESDEWEWKLVDVGSKDSVRSDFEVGNDAGNSGGLRVRLTFSMTASGLYAPLYVSVTGLSEEELSPELCPEGILAEKCPKLCKGGNDVFSTGFGWLVFLRADKKRSRAEGEASNANKKFIHYNQHVLLPFIREIRKELGWSPGQPIPEWLKACCWFDGDIPQLQTMLYEASEALDQAENIIRNKHSAAATGTQQPCDLSPVFKLLKWAANRSTATDSTTVGLKGELDKLFSGVLRLRGLNLDGNPRGKKALFDFLLCLPDIADEIMTAKRAKIGFNASGMTDKKTGLFPSWPSLMNTCKRWGSTKKDIGLPKFQKDICKEQFQHLMKIQLQNSQVTPEDMTAAGIPRDISSNGKEIEGDRPSGPDSEHLQYAKTINGEAQRKMREEKRRQRAAKRHADAVHEHNIIANILTRNSDVEEKITSNIDSGLLCDASLAHFLSLNVSELETFIHCRKFDGKTFHKSKLCGVDGKLNKTLRAKQTVEEIEAECSEEYPCLVWLAWKLRSDDLVLQPREMPILDISVLTPTIDFDYTPPVDAKCADDYLQDSEWIDAFTSSVKGVGAVELNEAVRKNADSLQSALEQRLRCHIAARVDRGKQNHWTLRFVHDNLAPMAAAICLSGHAVKEVETCALNERLLALPSEIPSENNFQKVSDGLGRLQGCYLYYDKPKGRWIRSGKTAGDGPKACFEGRGTTHLENSRKLHEMTKLRFYRKYPSRDVDNLGCPKGYFDDLVMYVGMAFNASSTVPLRSTDGYDSLFVWSEEAINELKRYGGNLEKLKLDAVSYLWELCYDIMLAPGENVSDSPGFEAFGLRVINSIRRTN